MIELEGSAYEIAKLRYMWDDEDSWEDIVRRISKENVKNENENKEELEEQFIDIIGNQKFIPGGRILRNLGRLRPMISNCFVLPIEDNIESIGTTLKDYLTVSSYGGGVGIPFHSLRPKGAFLKTKGGKSSGMLSFMKIFNYSGTIIETGGNRRVAALGLCNIDHPEIEEFIDAKTKHDELNMFNISVGVTEEFLDAVEKKDDWPLVFAGKTYKTVKAEYLWFKILDNMLSSAEPGLININNLYKNNTYYFSPIICTNACGELPLGAYEACLLGSMNLTKYIANQNTNWKKLEKDIYLAVRFLDNIIDLGYYPIKGQHTIVKNARRIGLGVMGLADYFFQKQIRYGSEKCIQELEKLFRFIRDKSYLASIELAKEKGSFPKFDKINYMRAHFIKSLPPKIRMQIKEYGIRNSCILSAQPTGTTSLVANVTSGIESLPFKAYKRIDRIGERTYVHPLALKNCSSDWFVDSYDLKPEEQLEVQVTIQKFIDSSLSKTILMPEDSKVEDLDKLLLEYIRDLKGVTVYRDNCRKEQVYYRLSSEETKKYIEENKVEGEFGQIEQTCRSGKCDL